MKQNFSIIPQGSFEICVKVTSRPAMKMKRKKQTGWKDPMLQLRQAVAYGGGAYSPDAKKCIENGKRS